MIKKKKKTKADLKREIKELKAQMAAVHHFAAADLPKAAVKARSGSGVLLELTSLGGGRIIPPILIRNGLSDETIDCLQADILRSYEEATLFKPKGAK